MQYEKTASVKNSIDCNFFILTSDDVLGNKPAHLSMFYGYFYDEDGIYIRINPGRILDKYTAGSFVNIQSDGGSIIITQDYFCSFGVYVFQKNGFWAISNSLFELIIFLASKYKLHINSDFDSLFLYDWLPYVLKETIISEISELAQGEYILIGNNADLSIHIFSYEKASIDVFSEAGLKVLDDWHHRYFSICRGVTTQQYELVADLTAGFDSRAALSVLFNPHVLDNIKIFSLDAIQHPDASQDYELAKRISEIYGIEMGQIETPSAGLSPFTSLLNSLKVKFYSTTGWYFKTVNYHKPVFRLTGFNGECLRGFTNETIEEYISSTFVPMIYNGRNHAVGAAACYRRSFDDITKRYNESMPETQKMYNYCRSKFHNGRSTIEAFVTNLIYISPLRDPYLYNLNITNESMMDRNAFFALIYNRYIPKISSLPINGQYDFPDKISEFVSNINQKYPFNPNNSSNRFTLAITSKTDIDGCQSHSTGNVNIMLDELFHSDTVRETISQSFSELYYKRIYNNRLKNYPLSIQNVIRILCAFWLRKILEFGDLKLGQYEPLIATRSNAFINSSYNECAMRINMSMIKKSEQDCEHEKEYIVKTSPIIKTFDVSSSGCWLIRLQPLFDIRGRSVGKEKRRSLLVDIGSILIVSESNGDILYSIKDRYYLGSEGIEARFYGRANDRIAVYMEWAPRMEG